jgi:rubrerythrin
MYNYAYSPQMAYCNPMTDFSLVTGIEEYIHDELKDSKYYSILATKAPTKRAKDLLMEFSRDEQGHAQNFMKAYYMLTGREYTPQIVEVPNVPDYKEALKERILAETHDYKKYGEEYLKACNPYLKDLFFMTRTVEAQHAMKIPLLMAEEV